MTVIFVWLGSAADYGSFGRWLLLALTVVCWALQYGMMAIRHPSQWPAAMAMYVVAYIAYGATLVFYAAVFPRLARYMPHVRKAREEDLKEGKITRQEYDAIESLERNHIRYGSIADSESDAYERNSNISTAHSNIGYLFTLALNLSVLLPLQNNTYSNNLALCLTNSYWVVLGVWWFIFQQKRPGPQVPKGSNYATIGFKQIWLALREVRSLPQTFLYFIAYFLLADGLNTTGTLVSIIQNDHVSFSFLQLTYLGITQAVCSITSTFGFWYIQKYFKFRTKTMFLVTNLFSALIPLWGMVGLWTQRIGYHNRSSIIGPNVIQAIINNTQNNWMGFPFLFTICAAAMITIAFVDVEKGRADARRFAEARKLARVAAETALSRDKGSKGSGGTATGVEGAGSSQEG
ncbi:conserved hypothetical protein [Aspergillus fumigatus A1163]|uniref:Autophagy-related protein n=2 Tax=Aspergillus fumigatus TaxID=746128 RepID=Q4WY47_ASPFU|nr:conserved hypothetical protein [Aspergillus fumigatus Af293]EAL92406.1 conserved hypothetical protein [Aspergillus fumigatus Af293]EDP52576.1 conserved hypothetical protein [Aspergillus fumigatus A1163]